MQRDNTRAKQETERGHPDLALLMAATKRGPNTQHNNMKPTWIIRKACKKGKKRARKMGGNAPSLLFLCVCVFELSPQNPHQTLCPTWPPLSECCVYAR